ncbi:Chitin binding Peritrophin-A domain-containing protein [Cribrihabitans marinus]|uniref:Chitin binding Peritrophin-A domain-containing protein n=1 Tax=Cribrihabitans marinus TaxID=1227549 RepID=A0A1H6V956_9RHOB|nr:chitin-binding domain-containing protein [Cribrihabitans marinus]GGH26348.1 hypothetical protein GCM10010973_14070 [Cribrihabitans marinus]SEI99444.1 Chitin binding Peritrophin-A domain-containing protein [Cribrihabitans marinus]
MKFKTIACALALSLSPALAFAGCVGHEKQSQSCAPGSVWDAVSQSCVESASS